MLRPISAGLMLIAGLGHLAVFFTIPSTSYWTAMFGTLYSVAAMVQIKGLKAGDWMTIIFALSGISRGLYDVAIIHHEPVRFGALFLVLELAAAACSGMYLVRTHKGAEQSAQ